MAGRSARQEAAQYPPGSRISRSFDWGGYGEELTARYLNPLSGDGWWVLHDLAVPASDANIDHIVVGPPGIFVVDSKHWSSPARDGGGTLWVGRYPKRYEIGTLLWELDAVRKAVGPDAPLADEAIISLTDARPVRTLISAPGVTAVAVDDLVDYLRRQPSVLTPSDVDRFAELVDRALRSKSGAPSSMVRPDPLPALRHPGVPSVGQPGPPTVMAEPAGLVAVAPEPTRPTHRRGRPNPRRTGPPVRRSRTSSAPGPSHPARLQGEARQRSARRDMTVVAALAALAVLVLASRVIHPDAPSAHRSVTVAGSAAIPAKDRSAPSASPPTTVLAPGLLVPRWSCVPGDGWTASFPWPASTPAPLLWMLQTGPTSTGPWYHEHTGVASQSVTLPGLQTGEHGWARIGNLVTLQSGGQPLLTGPVVVPAGC